MTISLDPQEGPAPEEAPRKGRTPGGSANSCRNAIKTGRRSLTQFPEDMMEQIAAKEAELIADMKPANALEATLLTEIARATVQVQACLEYVQLDARRVIDEAESCWDDDRRNHVNTMAERLAKAPQRIAAWLESSQQGAQYCLDRWRELADTVEATGGLTEPQRQFCFDLLGVAPLAGRDGTARVPAGGNTAALRQFIADQVRRIERRIVLELQGRDVRAQALTRLGLPRVRDTQTRNLKSDLSQARKRLQWATDRFLAVQHGVVPPDWINPAPGRPAAGAGPAAAAPTAATRPAAAPATPPPSASPAASRSAPAAAQRPAPRPAQPTPPLEEQFSPEVLEGACMLDEMITRQLRKMGLDPFTLKPDGSAPPPPNPLPPGEGGQDPHPPRRGGSPTFGHPLPGGEGSPGEG
jgi:hypothetical protein